MVGSRRERSSLVLRHAICTNSLEDLFPQSRASPLGLQTGASKFIQL